MSQGLSFKEYLEQYKGELTQPQVQSFIVGFSEMYPQFLVLETSVLQECISFKRVQELLKILKEKIGDISEDGFDQFYSFIDDLKNDTTALGKELKALFTPMPKNRVRISVNVNF